MVTTMVDARYVQVLKEEHPDGKKPGPLPTIYKWIGD